MNDPVTNVMPTDEPTAVTADGLLEQIRDCLPYSVSVEVYTDTDAGWDVYVHGDLPGWDVGRERTFRACRTTLHEALTVIADEVETAHAEWAAMPS